MDIERREINGRSGSQQKKTPSVSLYSGNFLDGKKRKQQMYTLSIIDAVCTDSAF